MANEEASELRKTVTRAASRIQEIIDVAERVAGDIRADAEAEAQTYLAERKREADRLVETRAAELSQISSDMLQRSTEVQTKIAEFVTALDRALEGIRSMPAPPDAEPAASRAAPQPVSESALDELPPLREPEPTPISKPRPSIPRPIAYPGKAAGSESEERPDEGPAIAAARQPRKDLSSEAALVRATQLAVAGRERAEIEAAIQDEFEIDDPTPVVDQILGKAS